MKSVVKEILARSPDTPETPEIIGYSSDDAELERLLTGLKTNIKIFGLGGAGSNTIDRLVEAGVMGVELYACNTDAQHLLIVRAPHKLLLGRRTTKGLGAGAIPQIGEVAAKESEEELKKFLTGADLVFVTCGLGGGTGTGSAHVVAHLAKEMAALTIAVCTLPFGAEGAVRAQNAEFGLEKLRAYADTVITIPNDRLLELVPRLPLVSAFKMADEVLMHAIKGITEVITKPGLVNLDFNDFRSIMRNGGVAMIGLGESDTEDRATDAIMKAINSPLLDVDITGASGALINVVGGNDMSVTEAEKVAEVVHDKVNPNAKIIWGAAIDPALEHKIRVMLLVTGVKSRQIYGRTEPRKGEVGVDVIK